MWLDAFVSCRWDDLGWRRRGTFAEGSRQEDAFHWIDDVAKCHCARKVYKRRKENFYKGVILQVPVERNVGVDVDVNVQAMEVKL